MTSLRYHQRFQLGLILLMINQLATAVGAVTFEELTPLSFNASDEGSTKETLIAQIIPDNTLGNESSAITNDMIGGGTTRGMNLFHSFQEFNVNTGQEVYFANPVGIENILSRVTGSNLSEIDGLLGVDGAANLFLLNPNGITFGPNTELDIRGSFTASTADTYQFEGAAAPVDIQGSDFLTMSVPLGVQREMQPQGDISSTGNLETGQDLVLLGNQLYLEGQVIAGEDLTLQAKDTVTIRDTATDAFIARSEDALTIQGDQGIDIWTLQHLEQTPFVSEGDLILISDGAISGDAHFESGGNLQFLTVTGTPANVLSFYDPIIFADGNVIFGDYEGAALKIEATGSIRAGTIRITGSDTTLTTDGSKSDEDLLASRQAAAILRAGVESISDSNSPQIVETTILTTDTMSGESPSRIVVNSVNTSRTDGTDGGTILLAADGDITIVEALRSFSSLPASIGDAGNGGNISISSVYGDILVNGNLSAFSLARSSVGDAGNGGNISISSISGDILTNGRINSFSEVRGTGNTGNGGNISISSIYGDIAINERLNAFTFIRRLVNGGNAGSGGELSVSSIFGDITINQRLNSFSASSSGGASNGGNVSISSIFGDVSTNRIDSSSSFYIPSGTIGRTIPTVPTGNGGNIFITSTSGNISNNGFLVSASVSRNGDVGNGGNISILTREGVIRNNNNRISTVSASGVDGNTGAGGKVTLQATSISDLGISTLSSAGVSGDVEIQGSDNNLAIRNLRLITSGQIEVSNPIFGDRVDQIISLDLSDFDQSGKTLITSAGDLTLDGIEILSDANRAAAAGNVEIFSGGDLQLNDSQILSNTNPASIGNGGNILLIGEDSVLLSNSLINTDTDGKGIAGRISISTPQLTLQNDAQLTSETGSSEIDGSGGDISIAANEVILSGRDTDISVRTNDSANAGNITLEPLGQNGNITLSTIDEGPQFSASNTVESSGRGGNIIIRDADIALLKNTDLVTSSEGSGNAGNIIIRNVNVLLMRQGSLIQAGASDVGNGGNVDLDAAFVVTVPNENNDILANAREGAGGNIDITANRIIGFQEVGQFSNVLRNNESSDISAQSEFNIDGEISINNLLIDPNQGLTELPFTLEDPTDRIGQGCRAAQSEETSLAGDFIITGQGGQASSPENLTSSDITPLDDFGPIDAQTDARSSTIAIIETDPPKELKDSQNAIMTESGDVFLVASDGWNSSISCSNLR